MIRAPRSPMTEAEAAERANRLLERHRRYINRPSYRNDEQAFQQIKRSGQVEQLDKELRKALGL